MRRTYLGDGSFRQEFHAEARRIAEVRRTARVLGLSSAVAAQSVASGPVSGCILAPLVARRGAASKGLSNLSSSADDVIFARSACRSPSSAPRPSRVSRRRRLSAQLVEAGVARDAKLGTPLDCLHVALLDSAGRAIQHTVTDSSGQFMLEAPRPGRYRVQFLIYRWEPLVGPVDTLAEGAFKHRVYPLTFANMLVADTSSVRQQGAAT